MSKSQPKHKLQKPAVRAQKPAKSASAQTPGPATPLATTLGQPDLQGLVNGLPDHLTSQSIRQSAILNMQRGQGNGYVQRYLRRAENQHVAEQHGEGRGPAVWLANPQHPAKISSIQRQVRTEDLPGAEEKAAANTPAQAAESSASQAASPAQTGAASAQTAAGQEGQAGQNTTPQSIPKQAGSPGANGQAGQSGPTLAQAGAGQAQSQAPMTEQHPGAATVTPAAGGAEGNHAPTSAQEDEGFLTIIEQIRQKAGQQKSHPQASQQAGDAQAAAESPAAEKLSKANAGHVQEIESAEEPAVDRAGLKSQLMQKIEALAPRTAEEADQLKSSGKLNGLKADLKSKMADEKKKSVDPIKQRSEAAPSQAGIAPKAVKPLAPPAPLPPMQQFNATPAVPKPKPVSEIEKPLKKQSKSLDQQMAEAEITEEQLGKSNEPEFEAALKAKKEAQSNAKEAPQKYREEEGQQIAQAREDANTSANEELQGMHQVRQEAQSQVGQDQGQAKSADEAKRQEVADTINGIYDNTKASVDNILRGLDAKVNPLFEAGAAAAQAAFEAFVSARMEAYKQSRYGGVLGWARWAQDKLLGMPPEVNQFYVQGREQYLSQMDAVIDGVVTIIASTIAQAKNAVARGRAEMQDYVNQLPVELRQVGQDAAAEIQESFDQLELQVDQSQQAIIDQLAQSYAQHLQIIDARVEQMQAENRGLLQAAADAITGVVRTISGLTRRLASIFSRVASAVTDIMRDPVGFLGNLLGAVKTGLMNFVGNIASHLQHGLMSWLFKTLKEAGIELPARFDMQGILSMIMRILGMTWASIRARMTGIFGERMVGILENVFDVFRALKSEGISGLFRFVQDRVTGIKDTIVEALSKLVSSEIVQAGIQRLIGILGTPAGAFIQAVESIHHVISWLIGNGGRIFSLVRAIMGSITSIVSGSVGQAAEAVEQALARSLPLAINFLADILGLGGLSGKIVEIIQRVREPVDRVIDWLIDRARGVISGLGGLLGGDESAAGGGTE